MNITIYGWSTRARLAHPLCRMDAGTARPSLPHGRHASADEQGIDLPTLAVVAAGQVKVLPRFGQFFFTVILRVRVP
jgi:hypothetical protein